MQITRKYIRYYERTKLFDFAASSWLIGADDGGCGTCISAATGGKVSSVLLVAIPVLLIALTVIFILASRYCISLRKKLDQINRLFLDSL